jgi:hypothetical protein
VTNASIQPLDPLTVQRLAFIRFLYEHGVGQANEPEPLSATAVLSLHDAVELFLRLAAEQLRVNLPTNVQFAEYWTKLQAGLPANTELPSKNAMDRMNRLRVALKHHGTIPSFSAIDQARGDVTTFLTDATLLVFGITFASIDLIDMVARKETAELLRAAQTHADAGDFVAGAAGLVIAFNDLINHYALRSSYESGDRLSFGPTLGEYRSPAFPHDDVLTALERVTTVATGMQQALRLIALGIDYRRFVEFDALTPRVQGPFSKGDIYYTVTAAHENLTEQGYQTCRRFVIESALQAAKADAALDAKTRHRQINSPEPGMWHPPTQREWTGPATSPEM